MIILKNKTASVVHLDDAGRDMQPNEVYSVPPQDYPLWAASAMAVEAILNDLVVVNDGSDDLNRRVGIALLQNNVIVLNEYYTLTDEEGILMGNGSILYLNDELYTTDNVIDVDDEAEVDDNPTNA